MSVGRQEGSDLWVSDPHMSRHHFLVEGFESGFRLRDLDSRNGTKLNGINVTVATLHSGDFIVAGTTTLCVEFCAGRYDTLGQDPTTRLDDRSVLPLGAVAAPGLSQSHVADVNVAHDDDRIKNSDDETQLVIDEAIISALLAMNPAVAPLGVHNTGAGDHAFSETVLVPPLGPVCMEGREPTAASLTPPSPTAESPSSSAGQASDAPVGGQNDRGMQATEAASANAPPQTISAESSDISIPDGLEGFKLRRLPEFKAGCGFVLPQAGVRAVDLCEHLGQFYRLLLVVNRSQLDPTCASLLDYLVEQGVANAVTQTIYRIDGDTASAPLLQLLRRASRRDAAVCLGFRYTDSDPHSTIAELSHLVCYPSLLFSQLTRLTEDAPQLFFKKVVFFLFEKDLTGDLYLFAERGFRPAGTLVK